jgi:hypothetical protein
MSVIVSIKIENPEERGGLVVVVSPDRESPEACAAREAGVPFPYKPHEMSHLGWMNQTEAEAVAAEHGVRLAYW